MSVIGAEYLRELASELRASAQHLGTPARDHTLEMAKIYERVACQYEDRDEEDEGEDGDLPTRHTHEHEFQ